MKRNLLILVIILLIGFIVNSCGGDEKEPPACNLGEHLGIGETCNGTNCTYKDYRTVDMKNESHNDYFQWPIYRVGELSNYGENDLTSTVDNILTGYKGLEDLNDLPNLKKSSLEQVHITYNASVPIPDAIEVLLGKYTWNGTILGIQKGNAIALIKQCMVMIGNNTLPQQVAVAL